MIIMCENLKNTNQWRDAFTLAEVLITLGVIGVVAAMTLPTLIHNYQVKQWETLIKQDYTLISSGFQKIVADYGVTTLDETGIFNQNGTTDPEFNENMANVLKKVFNNAKIYKVGEYPYEHIVSVLYGNRPSNSLTTANNLIMELPNGSLVFLRNSGCVAPANPIPTYKLTCAGILVDINGTKAPNSWGKDVFNFGRITERGKIIPDTSADWAEATNNTREYWKNNPEQCGHAGVKLKDETLYYIGGSNCLARIMENNWEMDYLK